MHRFRKKSDAKRAEGPAFQQQQPSLSPSNSSSSTHTSTSSLSPQRYPGQYNTQFTQNQYSAFPAPIVTQHVVQHPPPDPPSLPPISDFRTSLILPDLSRRFTVLRSNANGVNLDDLRNRFAEQRAKSAENQISEEEENMLLDMLSRIRAQTGSNGVNGKLPGSKGGPTMRAEPSQGSLSSTEETSTTSSTVRQSAQSTITMSSMGGAGYDSAQLRSMSPTSPSRSKRHSNQLFAGGQLRDLRTMRKTSNRTIGSNRSVLSTAPSEAASTTTSGSVANALIDFYSENSGARSTTPDNASPPLSPASSPVSPNRKNSVSSVEDILGPLPGSSHLRIRKELTNNQLKRISMCLDDALKEMEEEAEDQVLVPRTSQVNGSASSGDKNAFALTTDDRIVSPVAVTASSSNTPFTGTTTTTMDMTPDIDRPASRGGYRSPSPYRAGGATSPVPRVPGYIPGMPRPVTPHRDADNLEDVRSLSITPRAASSSISNISSISGLPISSPAPSLLRQAVNASPSPYGSRPKSPHSSVRYSTNVGRAATPDERSSTTSADHAPLSSHWRRPSSPLSTNSNAFQSLNGGSRPGTPSNVTWNITGRNSGQMSRPLARNGTLTGSGHSRNGSVTSIGENEWKENKVEPSIQAQNSAAGGSNVVLRSPKPVYRTSVDEESRPKFLSTGSSMSASALAFIDFDPSIGTNPLPLSPTPPVHRTKSPALPEEVGGRTKKSVASQLITPPTSPFANKFNNDSNPLLLSSSLSNNSSRSSLVSAGSSYHSWEEENGAGGLFVPLPGGQDLAWHDITSSSNLSSQAPSRSQSRTGNSNKDDPEVMLKQYTGLSKTDLLAIQGKLIEASQARTRNADVRASSTLRRRRPSTAQSIHSTGPPSRTTSPAPRIGSQWATTSDSAVKGVGLLDSVLDSLRLTEDDRERHDDLELRLEPPVIPALSQLATSSPGRRNKDLTDILFGSGEENQDPLPPVIDSEPSPLSESISFYKIDKQEPEPTPEFPHYDEPFSVQSSKDHSEPVIPDFKTAEDDQTELMRQVQERTQAAMAQLKKSPQQTRFPSLQPPGPRKRIQLQDISSPHLIQSSTSVDKLPGVPLSPAKVRDLDTQRTVKFSLSKRLRNTLKSKPSPPNGEEVTPFALDSPNSASFSSSSPHNSHQSLAVPKTNLQSSGSVSDHGSYQFKGYNVSPPASAGPNLKTFMSRFRKKGQEPPAQKNFSMPPPSSSAPSNRRSFQFHPSGALVRSGSVSHAQAEEERPIVAPMMSRETTERPPTSLSTTSHPSQPSDPNALKQFYEAAQNLGLDQSALNEFLSRSGSLTSKPSIKRVNPPIFDNDLEEERSEHVQSPVIPEVFIEQQGPAEMSRSNTLRQSASSPMPAVPRRVRDSTARNTILRRTLIFPSTSSNPNANGSTTEVHMPTKKTPKSVKRASNLSVQSNRSLIDRVPTPPPSKAKRQSVEPSPPMPNLPASPSWISLGRPSMSRSPPTTPIDHSRSPYEMYAGDGSASTEIEPPKTPEDGMPDLEEGQALEVIELANGETIWSIVNGLRADDTESFYNRRGSFESEFSLGHQADSDAEQLFFREHTRSNSKSSNTSNLGRRRSHVASTANRPETKVFYSSSAHIARLIESLSHNTEAATFNIKPNVKESGLGSDFGMGGHHFQQPMPHLTSHSHSNSLQTDSDTGFTVEERLDRMIDRVNSSH